jgi:hypothetical protein
MIPHLIIVYQKRIRLKKMRCLNIGHDEFLVYDENVAGFFNTYRQTGNKGIHRVENRKLSDEEIENLKDGLDDIDDINLDPNEEDYDVINNIVKFYPEVRYFIHGLNVVEAKKPKRIVKKQEKAKQKKLEEEAKKAKKVTPETEKRDPALQKQLDDAEKNKKAEEDRKQKLEKSEKGLSETGKKDKNKFTGFKGLLFDMFKGFEDPKTKAEKDKKLKEIREGWKFYEKNKKLLEQNAELVNSLHSLLDAGELTPQSIALMNELVARDKGWVKHLDVEADRPPTISLPLDKFKNYVDKDSQIDMANQLKDLFEEEKIGNVKLKVDSTKNTVDVTTDWNNAMKIIKTFNIKTKDLTKPLTA